MSPPDSMVHTYTCAVLPHMYGLPSHRELYHTIYWYAGICASPYRAAPCNTCVPVGAAQRLLLCPLYGGGIAALQARCLPVPCAHACPPIPVPRFMFHAPAHPAQPVRGCRWAPACPSMVLIYTYACTCTGCGHVLCSCMPLPGPAKPLWHLTGRVYETLCHHRGRGHLHRQYSSIAVLRPPNLPYLSLCCPHLWPSSCFYFCGCGIGLGSGSGVNCTGGQCRAVACQQCRSSVFWYPFMWFQHQHQDSQAHG